MRLIVTCHHSESHLKSTSNVVEQLPSFHNAHATGEYFVVSQFGNLIRDYRRFPVRISWFRNRSCCDSRQWRKSPSALVAARAVSSLACSSLYHAYGETNFWSNHISLDGDRRSAFRESAQPEYQHQRSDCRRRHRRPDHGIFTRPRWQG